MIFVDSNVIIYAVGRKHQLQHEARDFFLKAADKGANLVTSAEVLQELIHVYLPVNRVETMEAAFELVIGNIQKVLPVSEESVLIAKSLSYDNPGLEARDLIHAAICKIHNIKEIKTFDRKLASFFKSAKRR
ncbi:MAG: type II toxin-antitoxin system VapC family toxin [Deltaproteobacteria bacterium]|nr:type II toxin-antitoxin system VapC family toxin [Deltaproteobacteria bacterium]